MFAMSRLRLLVAVIVGAAGVACTALLALVAFSSTAEADHSWGNYHWEKPTSNPLTLNVGDNVDAKWDRFLDEAISDWDQSKSAVLDLTEVVGGINPKRCNALSGRIDVCNASYGRTGWLGIAGISVSGGHITKAYSKLNDTYFDTAKYNKDEWRRLVMCQEIAHDFGLDHQDENFDNPNLGSCMDYTSNPLGPPSNEHPNSHDYDQLKSIYGHNHDTGGQTSTQNRLPAAAANEADRDDEGPRQWGRLIRQSPDGRLALYEKDLGRGHKFFRFVIWAEDAPQAKRDARHDEHEE